MASSEPMGGHNETLYFFNQVLLPLHSQSVLGFELVERNGAHVQAPSLQHLLFP